MLEFNYRIHFNKVNNYLMELFYNLWIVGQKDFYYSESYDIRIEISLYIIIILYNI